MHGLELGGSQADSAVIAVVIGTDVETVEAVWIQRTSEGYVQCVHDAGTKQCLLVSIKTHSDLLVGNAVRMRQQSFLLLVVVYQRYSDDLVPTAVKDQKLG